MEGSKTRAHLTLCSLLPASARGLRGISCRQPPSHLLPKMLPIPWRLCWREPGPTPARSLLLPQLALELGPASTRQTTGLGRCGGSILSKLGWVRQLGEPRGPGAGDTGLAWQVGSTLITHDCQSGGVGSGGQGNPGEEKMPFFTVGSPKGFHWDGKGKGMWAAFWQLLLHQGIG